MANQQNIDLSKSSETKSIEVSSTVTLNFGKTVDLDASEHPENVSVMLFLTEGSLDKYNMVDAGNTSYKLAKRIIRDKRDEEGKKLLDVFHLYQNGVFFLREGETVICTVRIVPTFQVILETESEKKEAEAEAVVEEQKTE
jgi:hypothetical protein